jgi:hypothetical protein
MDWGTTAMPWYAYVGIAVACGVLLVLWTAWSRAGRAIGEAHLQEIVGSLSALKPTALADLSADSAPPHFVTTEGVLVAYGITQLDESTFEHHVSLSRQGAYLARATGLVLLAYLLDLMRVEPASARVFTTQNHVLHAAWQFDASVQAVWASHDFPSDSSSDVQDRLRRAVKAREGLRRRLETVQVPVRRIRS